MKRIIIAAAAACVLSTSAIAGDIPSGGIPQPQPQQMASPTIPGDIPSVGQAMPVSDGVLSALLTALNIATF